MSIGKGHKMRVVPTKLPFILGKVSLSGLERFENGSERNCGKRGSQGQMAKILSIEMRGSALIVYLATGNDDLPNT